jgi:hypothetical protein
MCECIIGYLSNCCNSKVFNGHFSGLYGECCDCGQVNGHYNVVERDLRDFVRNYRYDSDEDEFKREAKELRDFTDIVFTDYEL